MAERKSVIPRAPFDITQDPNDALSGEWELISEGEHQGRLCKLILTDKGFVWIVAKFDEYVSEGEETTIEPVAYLRNHPNEQ